MAHKPFFRDKTPRQGVHCYQDLSLKGGTENMALSRGDWVEWEGNGVEGDFVFMINGWIIDDSGERSLLAHALRDMGVTSRILGAHTLASAAEFAHAWYGFIDGEIVPEVCDSVGYTHTGEQVDTARQCTFAILSGAGVPA